MNDVSSICIAVAVCAISLIVCVNLAIKKKERSQVAALQIVKFYSRDTYQTAKAISEEQDDDLDGVADAAIAMMETELADIQWLKSWQEWQLNRQKW